MYRTYRLLYRLGIAPWERAGIPAPVAALATGAPLAGAPGGGPLAGAPGGGPGRAVDLGCGTGEQARYLAEHGWTVTAVDFVPAAIAAARRRDPGGVTWRVADVCDLGAVDPDGRLAGGVALLLDNGCLHGIPVPDRAGWARTVTALAAPGAALLVRAAPRRYRGIGPQGIDGTDLTGLLSPLWTAEPSPGPGWYRYTRQ